MVFNATALLGTIGLGIVIFVLPSTRGLAVGGVRGAFEAEHLFGGGLPVLYFGIFVLHAILMATFFGCAKDHGRSLGISARPSLGSLFGLGVVVFTAGVTAHAPWPG